MILNKFNPESIDIASDLLRSGSVCVLPCDTIYGLCSAYPIGENALKAIKGRDANKPFLILATLEQAKSLCIEIPSIISEVWPAPLTVILNTKDGKKTGIRVPDDAYLQKLLNKTGCPIFSTSVNISGEPSMLNFSDICNRFESVIDFLVKGPEIQGTVPSTLIDATQNPYRILRQGQFDVSDLIAKSFLKSDAFSI